MKKQSLNGLPEAQGLYNPAMEHDACGIGFIADIKGKKSHAILEDAQAKADAIIADAFEAFLGALFLDQGMGPIDNILGECITPRLASPEDVGIIHDYKTKLQEYVQSDSRRTVKYELVSERGQANQPTFVMNVVVDGLVLGTGEGPSKKQAEQNAARSAFEKLAK